MANVSDMAKASTEEVESEFREAVRRALRVIDPAQVGLAVLRAHQDAAEPQEAKDMLQLARTFSSLGIQVQQRIVAEEAAEWRNLEAAREADLGGNDSEDEVEGDPPEADAR